MAVILNLLVVVFILSSIGCSTQNADSATEPSTFEIEEIIEIDDATTAIIALDEHLNDKCNYGETLSALSHAEKVVFFIENLEREINNGGFNQFYFNSSGDYAHDTHNALLEIGAVQTAKIVQTAHAEWPNSRVTKNQNKRQNVLLEIESEAEAVWNECDEAFYAYNDNLTALLFEYVKKNKADFN